MLLYWSKDGLYNTTVFSEVMSRNRFYLLLKFFHFSENEDENYNHNDENQDCFHKFQSLINSLREQFSSVYEPGKKLSIDKSLVLFKDRLHFWQYIRTKRAHFGIKLYELTTSDGLTLDSLAYCGKGMFADNDINEDMPSTKRIPSVLMNFLGKTISSTLTIIT